MSLCIRKSELAQAEAHCKSQGIMRGLIGERLLKRLVGSILHRPGFDSSPTLGSKLENGEETAQESCDPQSEKTEAVQELEKPEETNTVIRAFDPND